MGKECMAWLRRRLWGGTSLKTAAKEASSIRVQRHINLAIISIKMMVHVVFTDDVFER